MMELGSCRSCILCFRGIRSGNGLHVSNTVSSSHPLQMTATASRLDFLETTHLITRRGMLSAGRRSPGVERRQYGITVLGIDVCFLMGSLLQHALNWTNVRVQILGKFVNRRDY